MKNINKSVNMNDYLFVNNFILVSINIFSILLVCWVYFSGREKKTNQYFSLMIISILFWVDFYHVASFFTEDDLSLKLFRISATSVFTFFTFYYLFIVCFLDKRSFWDARIYIIKLEKIRNYIMAF